MMRKLPDSQSFKSHGLKSHRLKSPRLKPLLLFCVLAGGFAVLPAFAQTVVPVPGETIPNVQNNLPVAAPVSARQVEQAQRHLNGQYDGMSRYTYEGGQVQEIWNEAGPKAGMFEYQACPTCTYKITLRQHMVTVIELPEGEVIATPDIGDSDGFTVEGRGPNTIAVRPNGFGIDTSMIVYGQAGRIYPFYLRAEGVHSGNLPDLYVKVNGVIPQATLAVEGFEEVPVAQASPITTIPVPGAEVPGGQVAEQDFDLTFEGADGEASQDDFVKSVPFDAAKLHGWGKYTLWGEGWRENQKPLSVFRDDRFTYIYFGSNILNKGLPVAYVVVDEIDELVNTRINGDTFIVESINPLITLKSGEAFLCIRYDADTADVPDQPEPVSGPSGRV